MMKQRSQFFILEKILRAINSFEAFKNNLIEKRGFTYEHFISVNERSDRDWIASPKTLLECSFCWAETKEGNTYWYRIASMLPNYGNYVQGMSLKEYLGVNGFNELLKIRKENLKIPQGI